MPQRVALRNRRVALRSPAVLSAGPESEEEAACTANGFAILRPVLRGSKVTSIVCILPSLLGASDEEFLMRPHSLATMFDVKVLFACAGTGSTPSAASLG